jgi:hypothetical protein
MSAERIGTDDLLPEIRSARTTLEVTQLAVRVLDTQDQRRTRIVTL